MYIILNEINSEDNKNPYTDQELARRLNLSRADVISFRKKHNIPDSRERRKICIIKDLKKILEKNEKISERKITELLIEQGYNISRGAVSKFIKEENLKTAKIESGNDEKVEQLIKENIEEDGFEDLIGIKGSLKEKVNLAKSAIKYPPNGLHTMIYGETGVGKSELASCMHKYAIKNNIREENCPFIIFNCADYAENPNLLNAQLFGVVKGAYTGADSSREGLVEKANNGILFLDEIHRLPPSGQEILFSLIDRGEFRRLGESDSNRKANVLIISATTENPDSNLLSTFRRRIPMFIKLPNLGERPDSERYEIIYKFFETEARRVNKNFIITKEVIESFMTYECKGNIGQLKSDIQVVCAKAFSRVLYSNDKVIIDLDSLREQIKKGYNQRKVSNFKIEDIYIDINDVSPKKNRILSENEISEIYNYAEKELKLLENRCSSKEELKELFIKKLDNKFEEIKNNENLSNRRKQLCLEYKLKESTLVIMDQIIELLRAHYKHINNGLYLALAMHIEQAIDRIKSGKNIVNPSLDQIKIYMPEEYDMSKYIIGIIENTTGEVFPEDELGYLAYYLNKFCYSEDISKDKVRVVIVTHGKVGIEIAKVVNYILGVDCVVGIEIDLSISSKEGMNHVLNEIEKIEAPKGMVVLVDMGSLVILGDEVEKRFGIRCKTISRVDTLLAMEVTKLASIQGKTLDTIISDLEKNKNYPMLSIYNQNYKEEDNNKKPVVITICLSGVGTALNLKEQLEKGFRKIGENIEIKSLGFLNSVNLDEELQVIEKEYNIIAICGTINIEYKNVPFIPYDEVINKNGVDKILEYISKKEDESKDSPIEDLIHEDLILNDFEGVSKEYTIDTLVAMLEDGGYVDSRYLLSVYKRESMGSAVMSSKIAIPHGLPGNVIKPAIAIAKLNKPIVWDNKYMVDMVVIMATKEGNKKEIRKLFSKLKNQEILNEILEAKDKNTIKAILG